MAPTLPELQTLFSSLSTGINGADFFNHVSDDVDWTILGHTPFSKNFKTKADFFATAVAPLGEKILSEPLRLRVVNITGAGPESDWAVVEMRAIDARCKNGMVYDMFYCWVCRFDDNGMIVQVRAYLDTDLLSRAIEQNP